MTQEDDELVKPVEVSDEELARRLLSLSEAEHDPCVEGARRITRLNADLASALEKLGAYVGEGWVAVPSEPTGDVTMTTQSNEIKWLREMLNEWMECADYDPTMIGPVFKGWNGSSLSRCLKKTLKYYEWVAAKPKPAQGKE